MMMQQQQVGMNNMMNMNNYGNGNFGMQQMSMPMPGSDIASWQGRQCMGTVRSFKGDWGFVISDMFAGDLFVGTRTNKHLPRALMEGDQIQFVVQCNQGMSR